MKRLYVFCLLLLSIFIVNAQVFKLSYLTPDDVEVEFTDVVHILLTPEKSPNVTYIHFENISGGDLNYKVQLTNEEINGGRDSKVQMCFDGQCLSDKTSALKTIVAGEKMEEFDLQYEYSNMNVSKLTVNFLSENNEVLQSFDVTYSETLDQVSLDKPIEKGVALSLSASPIPASTSTNIRYAVPNQYQKADLMIRNTLGVVVEKYNIPTGKNGKINVNVSDFNSGIYFYSIVADGKVLSTKKFVVKH